MTGMGGSQTPMDGQNQEENFDGGVTGQLADTTESPMMNGGNDLTETPMQASIDNAGGQTDDALPAEPAGDSQTTTDEQSEDDANITQKPNGATGTMSPNGMAPVKGTGNGGPVSRYRPSYRRFASPRVKSARNLQRLRSRSNARGRYATRRPAAVQRLSRLMRANRARSSTRFNRPLRYRNYGRRN